MKALILSLLCLLINMTCFADQKITVLDKVSKNGTATMVVPYLDGNTKTDLEANLNNIIDTEASQLVKRAGGNAILTYDVKLNRPSVVSILLKAQGNNVLYKALNLDTTTGREFSLNEFFVNDGEVKELLNNKEILFTDDGIKYPSYANGEFVNKVSYGDLIQYVRISEAGRLFQVARLTENSADKTLHLDESGLVAIKLPSNPSTGYSWQILPAKGVKEIGRSFNMPHLQDQRMGMPGEEILVLVVTGEGNHPVTFQYKRAWEKNYLQSFKVNIEVD